MNYYFFVVHSHENLVIVSCSLGLIIRVELFG